MRFFTTFGVPFYSSSNTDYESLKGEHEVSLLFNILGDVLNVTVPVWVLVGRVSSKLQN